MLRPTLSLELMRKVTADAVDRIEVSGRKSLSTRSRSVGIH